MPMDLQQMKYVQNYMESYQNNSNNCYPSLKNYPLSLLRRYISQRLLCTLTVSYQVFEDILL